jgi:type IV pilus assembly protein PilB
MASPLLDLLTNQSLLTPEQRTRAIEHAAGRDITEIAAVITLGFMTLEDIRAAGARAAGAQVSSDLALENADPEATRLLTSAQARRWHVIPMRFEGATVVIAATAATATNNTVLDNLRIALQGRPMKWVIADEHALNLKLNSEYRAEAELSSIAERAAEGDASDQALLAGRFVRLILNQAVTDRASDIHIEPGEREVAVRFRIDGVLIDKPVASKSMQNSVINQLKIMADLDIGINRTPQDGRMSHDIDGKRIELRVACLPTVWGEKIVMRILDNSAARKSLSEFSFSAENLAKYKSAYTKPHGMILVTGPTGSGKSTTLYSTLNERNSSDVNIITVEDPVEYRLPHINQIQVNKKAGMTFAIALRTILRSDPDIILIGEIRDLETARIAVEAAQTGHLVLTTLHTNNAPASPARLIEMGIEPFLVGMVLECVLAQRLVRRLCECKVPFQPTEQELQLVGFEVPLGTPQTFFTKTGCPKCSNTGYKGRFAVHEVMNRSEHLERAISQGKDTSDISRIAQEEGLVTLRQDGWVKVAAGVTTIEEILRVVA